ncbi:hypothetical protein Nepgr_013384 [Nepenthes gracilis]|uniref:Uncharacterized protein n=1 Tax=Nepenthes gracilis TaxID=150966 RepID=A0AAD3SHP9_NEPGR|nr:hypothetical protein Nepgr_013384 [Nepenthes gracilis]
MRSPAQCSWLVGIPCMDWIGRFGSWTDGIVGLFGARFGVSASLDVYYSIAFFRLLEDKMEYASAALCLLPGLGDIIDLRLLSAWVLCDGFGHCRQGLRFVEFCGIPSLV